MAIFFRSLITILLVLSSGVALANNQREIERCATAVLGETLVTLRDKPPDFVERLVGNFGAQVQLGDRSTLRRLLGDRVVRNGSIEYLPQGTNDPRLSNPNAETILLISRTGGDVVRLTLSSEIGQGRALLRHGNRVYLITLEASRLSGMEGNGPVQHRLRLSTESHYQEGIEWSALTEQQRERINSEMGRRPLPAANYREAHQTVALPTRVLMPSGHVFTQVDEPAFRGQGLKPGLSWRDESTGLIWSPAFEERMNWEEAKAACVRLGGRLPSIGEFRTWANHLGRNSGEAHHLFPRDTRRFWSSSRVFDNPNVVLVMDFYGGRTYVSHRYDRDAVRCVR